MRKFKIYTAGAMEVYGKESVHATEWRKKCKEYFYSIDADVKIVSPTDYYSYSTKYHKNGLEVMRFDLFKVKESDLILVNLNNVRNSIGTCDEIFYAWQHEKPIVGFVEKDVSGEELENLVHPWKYWQVSRIEAGENAMRNALEYIRNFYLN